MCCVELRVSLLHQGPCIQDSWLSQASLDSCFNATLACALLAGNLSGSHWIDNTLEWLWFWGVHDIDHICKEYSAWCQFFEAYYFCRLLSKIKLTKYFDPQKLFQICENSPPRKFGAIQYTCTSTSYLRHKPSIYVCLVRLLITLLLDTCRCAVIQPCTVQKAQTHHVLLVLPL